MRASCRIAFLILCMLPFMSSFAQSICTDNRYEQGGFTLSSTDICHNEAVSITNTAGVENPKYYYNYRGESYEEVMALAGDDLDFSSVTKPGLFRVIQIGKKGGKETVYCQEIKVRNSTTPVFSYTFCSSPTRIEIMIPNSHPLNEGYSGYQIEINGVSNIVGNANTTYPFPVGNVQNTIKITGIGGTKTCSSEPVTTTVLPFNASVGRDYEYYPAIKELKVLDDKSISIDFQGQYEQTYNLFRYEGGQPSVGLSPVMAGLKAGTPVINFPPDTNRVYCYYIQPTGQANCGVFSLRSADICSVPLNSPVPPTPAINHLQWRTYTGLPTGHRISELLKISDGVAETPVTVNNRTTYDDKHDDCSKRFCYRIRVSYTRGANLSQGVNYSGTSLSNQLCFDHRIDLTDFPPNAFVSTENEQNLVHFDPDKNSPYNLGSWELFRHDGTGYSLLETLGAGASNPVITDPDPVTKSEKYKVRYIDECANISSFSPELSSLYLTENGNNVLLWNAGKPFADTDITQYEVIYYEGDNQNNILGTRQVSASSQSHSINTASFMNMGTFRVKAIGADGTESFSNLLTFAVSGSLFLPTAFTPNGDQTNDTFAVKGTLGGIKTFRMEIFSPSGQKIADVSDPEEGWDGRMPNGDRATFGNYFYQLKAEMMNGQEINKNGSFVLLY